MESTNDGRAITVFYDGACPTCRDQVERRWRLPRRGAIVWRDLTWPVNPLHGEAFTLEAALAVLHAKDADGRLHVGLDAHLLIWERLPRWRWLAALVRRWPAARRLAEAGHRAFLRRRHARDGHSASETCHCEECDRG